MYPFHEPLNCFTFSPHAATSNSGQYETNIFPSFHINHHSKNGGLNANLKRALVVSHPSTMIPTYGASRARMEFLSLCVVPVPVEAKRRSRYRGPVAPGDGTGNSSDQRERARVRVYLISTIQIQPYASQARTNIKFLNTPFTGRL